MDVLDLLPPPVSSALSAILALRIAATISITLIVHDWVRDWKLELGIWKDIRRGKWTATLFAFLLQRYAAQFACWCAFTFLFGGPEIDCQALVTGVYAANIVFASAIAFIFAQRTLALYEFPKWLHVLLWTLWIALIACYTYVASIYRAEKLPQSFQGCNCNISTGGRLPMLGFAASLVFDLVVLILTLARISYLKLRSELGETIRSTSIIYFIAVGSVNLTLVLIIAISNDPTVHATPLGPSFAVTYLLLNSMVFSLRERSLNQRVTSTGITGTQHLEHYKRRHAGNSNGNNVESFALRSTKAVGNGSSGVKAESGAGGYGSGSGGDVSTGSGSVVAAGIPMTVTVAQKRSPINADGTAQEDFPNLRKQAFYEVDEGDEQSMSSRKRPMASDADLERAESVEPSDIKPYGAMGGPFAL